MKTINKIGDILGQFSAVQPEHALTDIARTMGNSVSSTHDIVSGLVRIGLLRKVERGRYRLGPLVASLFSALEDTSAVIAAARPVIDSLFEEYRETVHLTQHDQGRLFVVSAREGDRAVRVSQHVLNSDVALHQCAPGLLHLANLSPQAHTNYFKSNIITGLADMAELEAQIKAAGAADYAAGEMHLDSDVWYAAATIRNHVGMSVAALSLAIPVSRYLAEPRAFRSVTQEAARRISDRLKFQDW